MSARKQCTSCSKQIPNVALVCVFCSARQPAVSIDDGAVTTVRPSAHHTDLTLLGIKVITETALTEPAAKVERPSSNGAIAQTRPAAAMPAIALPASVVATAPMSVPVVEPARRRQTSAVDDQAKLAASRASFARLVMGVGGAVLLVLFCLPWNGVSSWHLIETLTGADFARQFFYLSGGVVLLLNALLPLPFVFRTGVGVVVPAIVLLLGGGGLPAGWHSLVAAFATVGLSVPHLVRWRAEQGHAARRIIFGAVAAIALLYLWPSASGVPIAAAVKLLTSGSFSAAVLGLFALVPLGLAARALLAHELSNVSIPFAIVILLWVPAAVALRGLASNDAAQMGVALGILCASATASLSLTQWLVWADRAQYV
jgi:hypothetical protein